MKALFTAALLMASISLAYGANCGSQGSSIIYLSDLNSNTNSGSGDTTNPSAGFVFSDVRLRNADGQDTTVVNYNDLREIRFSYEIDNNGSYNFDGGAYGHVWLHKGLNRDSDPENQGDDRFESGDLDPGKDEDGDENFYPPPPREGGYSLEVCIAESEDDDYDEMLACSSLVYFEVEQENFPIGYADQKNCNVISGWARDADTTGPIDVHVYADSTYVGSAAADQLRSDLPFADKNHGFTFHIPAGWDDGIARTWKVYGINYPVSSPNPLLERGSVELLCLPNYQNVVPLYRVYNTKYGGHFMHISHAHTANLPSPWRFEGEKFHVHNVQEVDSSPVCRAFRSGRGHFYTANLAEYNILPAHGFRQEGIAFYAYKHQKPGTVPIYRLYRSSTQTHLFTSSVVERDGVVARHGYRYEGIAFHAFDQ